MEFTPEEARATIQEYFAEIEEMHAEHGIPQPDYWMKNGDEAYEDFIQRALGEVVKFPHGIYNGFSILKDLYDRVIVTLWDEREIQRLIFGVDNNGEWYGDEVLYDIIHADGTFIEILGDLKRNTGVIPKNFEIELRSLLEEK